MGLLYLKLEITRNYVIHVMQRKNTALYSYIVYASIFLAILASLHANGVPSFPVQDAFHKGEFVAAAITVLQGAPFDSVPYTIHGAVDLWPALIVSLVIPERDMLLANTLVLYPIFSMLAVVFTALASTRLAQRFGIAPLMLVPFLLIAGLCIGWRDVFFALSLYLFARIVPDDLGRGGGFLAQILFGLVIAVGTYWSFNRGAAALIAFGLPTLWLATRHYRFAISIVTAILVFLAIGSSGVPGVSAQGYLENFVMLLQTSSQWGYSRSLSRDLWWILTVGTVVGAISLVGLRLRRGKLSESQVVLSISLLIGAAIYAKIGLGRIDQAHIVMGVWMPLLVVTLLLTEVQLNKPSWLQLGISAVAVVLVVYAARRYISILPIAATLIFAIAVLLGGRLRLNVAQAVTVFCVSALILTTGKIWGSAKKGTYAWLWDFPNLPAAAESVTPGIRWSAQSIRDSGTHCVFDLVNVGLINAVANLPACSRFTYPVYAGPQHERQLIEDLQRTAPIAILYKADFWSYAIDGKAMSSRFLALDAEILRLYPREECNLGFCLRFRQ